MQHPVSPRLRLSGPALLASLSLVFAAGCASLGVSPLTLHSGTPDTVESALAAQAEAFYGATSTQEMLRALEEAKRIAPHSALYHEIAASYALLTERRQDAVRHLISGLQDRSSSEQLFLLHKLDSQLWSVEEHSLIGGIGSALAESASAPGVRAFARFLQIFALRQLGETPQALDQLAETLGHRLSFAIVGTWDNDQGKAFDEVLPPESEGVKLDQRFDGTLLEIGWRQDLIAERDGQLDLNQALAPNDWAAAYAASAVHVPEAGSYELRLTSSDPFRVWVNGQMVLQARAVHYSLFDQFVVPIQLAQGDNQILIKTAQRTGSWRLRARLTGADGARVNGLRPLPPSAGPVSPSREQALTVGDLVQARVQHMPADSARRAYHEVRWAQWMGQRTLEIELGERFNQAHPNSILARYRLAQALWRHSERGRAADLLKALSHSEGDTLPRIRRSQAQFWRQQKMKERARQSLEDSIVRHPDRADLWGQLAQVFGAEGWDEDKCNAYERVNALDPQVPAHVDTLTECYRDQGYRERARRLEKGLLDKLPGSRTLLWNLFYDALHSDRFEAAKKYARARLETSPWSGNEWRRLARAQRLNGELEAARASYERAVALNPDKHDAYNALASMAYEQGDKEEALELWRKAFERNPDDDKLANRIDYLSAESRAEWTTDIPTEEEIEAMVAKRGDTAVSPGSDALYLLDDEVTRLHADGSTTNVRTSVVHALNERGRDRLTKLTLTGKGRKRVMHAFAVTPQGDRVEASSIRRNDVRFRGLAVGSTVVLQYREDAEPDGYMPKYMARSWFFQTVSAHVAKSRWVIWHPVDIQLHEWTRANPKRSSEERHGLRRSAWQMDEQSAIVPEPNTPTLIEIAAGLVISAVPAWQTFVDWEQALLHDVFRDSSDLKALSQSLTADAKTTREKVLAIHQFVMQEIRYQQDYENFIAGVKPHAAPVVIERRYGDCKDKVVLFTMLARHAGIDVHFALIRTRLKGPILKEVPFQQFNHVIPYIPSQEGLPEGRFFDPTADALDLESLRHDNAGTLSLVYNPKTGQSQWIDVPYQAPERNASEVSAHIDLQSDGSSSSTLEMAFTGRRGSYTRVTARNDEMLLKYVETLTNYFYPGSEAIAVQQVQVDDLMAPAKITTGFTTPHLARREGKALRVPQVHLWLATRAFQRKERRYPLVLGVPALYSMRQTVKLPARSQLSHVPEVAHLDSECLEYSQSVRKMRGEVEVHSAIRIKCERVSAEEYGAYWELAQQIGQLQKQELVVTLR